MGPYADSAWYAENFGPAPEGLTSGQLDLLLARASRTLRAEASVRGVNLDERIEAGRFEAALVADVVCEMVTEAASTLEFVGVSQFSQTGGPYTQSHSFRDTAGRLYVGKDARASVRTQRREGGALVRPDMVVALLGGEGIASVIAAVASLKAHKNSKQLEHNHGSSVADAVARIESNQAQIRSELKSHGYQLGQATDRLKHLEASLVGVKEEVLEERKARRREFAALEDDLENTFSRKERKPT